MRFSTCWPRALLIVASTALTLLAAEAITRLVATGPMLSHGVILQSPTRTVGGVALWAITAPRYGSQDLERAATDRDAFTIVGLGDSIMYGVGEGKEATYLEQARRELAGRSNRHVEVLNLAVPGYNTRQEDAVYEEIGDRIRADIVIVHYWSDDARQYREVGGYVADFGDMDADGHVVQALPLPSGLSDYLLLHFRLYDVLTYVLVTRNANVQTDDWANVTTPLSAISERAQRSGGRMLILASPDLGGEVPAPNGSLTALREFAAPRGIEVVDLSEWLAGSPSRRIRIDNCHFNAEGHRLLGERLAAYLLEHDLARHGG